MPSEPSFHPTIAWSGTRCLPHHGMIIQFLQDSTVANFDREFRIYRVLEPFFHPAMAWPGTRSLSQHGMIIQSLQTLLNANILDREFRLYRVLGAFLLPRYGLAGCPSSCYSWYDYPLSLVNFQMLTILIESLRSTYRVLRALLYSCISFQPLKKNTKKQQTSSSFSVQQFETLKTPKKKHLDIELSSDTSASKHSKHQKTKQH